MSKSDKIKVCICGGGSQGHISAGVIGSNPKYSVSILTRRPELWSENFETVDLAGKKYIAKLDIISSNPAILKDNDIVLVCVPGYAIYDELNFIKEYVKDKIIGSVFGGSGFFLEILRVLGENTPCFALQRVPFTGRVKEYGHSARLKGYKPYLKVGFMNIDKPLEEKLIAIISDWYKTPVYGLSHFLEATLSNSNPILHPCRLFVMFKDWTPERFYNRVPFLYDEWDDESSKLWVDCDEELRKIINKLPINQSEIPSILNYYQVNNIEELTEKIHSIEPFKGVQPHMIENEKGFKLDPHHRYFIEDIPHGLLVIKSFAEELGVNTPNIDGVLNWAQQIMNKQYIIGNKLLFNPYNQVIKNVIRNIYR